MRCGVISDEMLENITRSFLGLRQIPGRKDLSRVSVIPLELATTKAVFSIPVEEVRERVPLDLVLVTVNINEPSDRLRTGALAELYLSLEAEYPGRVVVAGTHLDEVRKLDDKSCACEA